MSSASRNISMSEWCIADNNSDDATSEEMDNFKAAKIIESVIVPLIGSLGMAGNQLF